MDNVLRVKAGLDYEAEPHSYTLNVVATDSGSPPLTVSGTVTVHVTDANDAPVWADAGTNNGATSLPEGSAAGVLVSDLAATDADAGDTLTYSIVGGNDAGSFAINAWITPSKSPLPSNGFEISRQRSINSSTVAHAGSVLRARVMTALTLFGARVAYNSA